MAVNSFDSVDGHPKFADTDAPDIKVDPQKVAEYAAEVGNRIVKADLTALNAYAYKRKGLRGLALDTMIEYIHDGSGWVRQLTLPGDPGSITPAPGSGYTLSSNGLYLRSGFLLGSIVFAKASAIVHAETAMTLPAGAIPLHEYNAHALFTVAATPSTLGQVRVQTSGIVQIVDPPAGRTGGTISFVIPVPV